MTAAPMASPAGLKTPWARGGLGFEAAGRLGARRAAIAEMRRELRRRFALSLMLAATIILAEAVSARAPDSMPEKLESAAPATVNAPAFVLPPPPPSDVLIRTRIRVG